MIYFACIDRAPKPGASKVRYFAAPPEALMQRVGAAVAARLTQPTTLTFLSAAQSPSAAVLELLPASEVCA